MASTSVGEAVRDSHREEIVLALTATRPRCKRKNEKKGEAKMQPEKKHGYRNLLSILGPPARRWTNEHLLRENFMAKAIDTILAAVGCVVSCYVAARGRG